MLNERYFALEGDYLFAKIARLVAQFRAEHPERRLFRHDIGDVRGPLTPTVLEAMHRATLEMGTEEGFRGYPPYGGEAFLREAVARYYRRFGVEVEPCEIFVSDGAKNDLGGMGELFGDVTALYAEPCYPVFRDCCRMSGRQAVVSEATEENGFLPLPKGIEKKPYLIYLCSPANPTGAVYGRDGLREWVEFALESGSVLLFDGAYEAYAGADMPHSIYEIEGARRVAVELTSLSKSAGFTGVRVSFAVFPRELMVEGVWLGSLWARRQSTKFNGISYISARGAEAALSDLGIAEWQGHVERTLEGGRLLSGVLSQMGVFHTGGRSPYIFMKCPRGMDSFAFFRRLLEETGIVGTPGSGFGRGGEGYFRLATFSDCRETAASLAGFLSQLKGEGAI